MIIISEFPKPKKIAESFHILLNSILNDELKDEMVEHISQSDVTTKIRFTDIVEKTCNANFGNVSKQELTEMINTLKKHNHNVQFEEMCVKLKDDKKNSKKN
ncbi:MAG: hypothetical protein WC934_06085 [Acidithiobacillus sp.]|uniref:hypothetical protein n=1 Tax=Acidithiobacillus sp. TaxID=1872118 RepID=UPI00355E1B60